MSSLTMHSIDRVREWLLRKHPERETIEAEEDLIANRLVDSLSFTEFTLVIEEASETEIDVENIDLDDFRTLAAIEKKHFS